MVYFLLWHLQLKLTCALSGRRRDRAEEAASSPRAECKRERVAQSPQSPVTRKEEGKEEEEEELLQGAMAITAVLVTAVIVKRTTCTVQVYL